MSSDCRLYDFMDNDKLERIFDELIEEKLYQLKLRYK
jgi:hypothetical protein